MLQLDLFGIPYVNVSCNLSEIYGPLKVTNVNLALTSPKTNAVIKCLR